MSIFKKIIDVLSSPRPVRSAPEPLTENQRWALAAGAQLTVLNRDRHDTLNPDPAKTQANWVNALERWWGIESHDDAVNMLQSLKQSGHRVAFRGQVGHDVLAWDLVRLINVARWAYAAGCFGEGEAWSYILDAAAELHRTYGSWDQLAHDYALGHDVWAGESDADFNTATAELLDPDNPGSPWNRVAWNTFRNLQ